VSLWATVINLLQLIICAVIISQSLNISFDKMNSNSENINVYPPQRDNNNSDIQFDDLSQYIDNVDPRVIEAIIAAAQINPTGEETLSTIDAMPSGRDCIVSGDFNYATTMVPACYSGSVSGFADSPNILKTESNRYFQEEVVTTSSQCTVDSNQNMNNDLMNTKLTPRAATFPMDRRHISMDSSDMDVKSLTFWSNIPSPFHDSTPLRVDTGCNPSYRMMFDNSSTPQYRAYDASCTALIESNDSYKTEQDDEDLLSPSPASATSRRSNSVCYHLCIV